MSQREWVAVWVAEHHEEVREWGAPVGPGPSRCLVTTCPRESFAVGLCKAHWQKAKRHATKEATR